MSAWLRLLVAVFLSFNPLLAWAQQGDPVPVPQAINVPTPAVAPVVETPKIDTQIQIPGFNTFVVPNSTDNSA